MKKQLVVIFGLAIILCSTNSKLLAQTDTWVQKANGFGTSSSICFSINDKGYFGLGSSSTNTFWEYDAITNVWTQKADFGGVARSSTVSFAVGLKGYIGTGISKFGAWLDDFWEYDQASNTWASKATFPGGVRYNANGFGIGAKGYLGMGYNGNYLKDLWEYDPATDTWTAKASLTGSGREGSFSFVIGTKAYLGGGKISFANVFTNDFWEYDQPTDSWTKKADFTNNNLPGTNRWAIGAFSIGTSGYAAGGGDNSSNIYKDFWEYKPCTDVWIQRADFGGGLRISLRGFTLNGKGYLGVGSSSLGSVTDFWEYTPAPVVSLPPPTISSFAPLFGIVGTSITIAGANFDPTPTNNIVNFNGTSAVVIDNTATSITVTVPTGATTGAISVTVGCNMIMSATNFVVPVCFPANGQNADVVLGQPDFATNSPGTSANKFAGAGDIAFDPTTGKVFISDPGNNRILRFSSTAAAVSGSAAEAVLGQPDFTSSANALTQSGFYNQQGITVDALGNLWVADHFNGRVLKFANASSLPNGAEATTVLGQPDFVTSSAAVSQNKINGPMGVAVDAAGNLWVGCRQQNRVLKFANAASLPNGANASVVIGQTNFVSSFTGLSQSGLYYPNTVLVDSQDNLWIGDEWNHRILKFANASTLTDGASATVVLGQTDFTSNSAGTSQNKFANPIGLSMDSQGNLYVGEYNNSRILRFSNAASLSNGANADLVLGKPDFTTSAGGTSQSNMINSSWVKVDPVGNIYVGDAGNRRVLRFSAPVAASVAASVCANNSATPTATGAGALQEYRWYDVATGGSSLSSSSSFATPPLTTSTTYYVSLFDGGCSYESGRNPVIVTINAMPTTPSIQPVPPICPGSDVTLAAAGSTDGNYRWYDGATLMAGEVNSTLTVTNLTTTKTFQVSANDGTCESIHTPITVSVVLLAKPIVASSRSIVSNSINICDGDSSSLIAPNGFTAYTWSNGESTSQITVDQSGVYSFTVTDANGCVSPSSDAVSVIVNPIPIAEITAAGTKLTASVGDLYQWYQNGVAIQGATNQSFDFNFLEYSVYAVDVTDNGCTSTSENFIYLITGQETIKYGIKVYPNPIREKIYIELPEQTDRIKILDRTGKTVLEKKTTIGRNEIETTSLANGMYFLLIHIHNHVAVYKIQKF